MISRWSMQHSGFGRFQPIALNADPGRAKKLEEIGLRRLFMKSEPDPRTMTDTKGIRLGGLFHVPHADLAPARTQHRRNHSLETNHRPYLIGERQPGQHAPSILFRSQQPRHFRPPSLHELHYNTSP